MKFFYFILLLLMVCFFGLIGWMNFTPGHFQQVSICDYPIYTTDSKRPNYVQGFCVPTTKIKYISQFLIALSSIDFSR